MRSKIRVRMSGRPKRCKANHGEWHRPTRLGVSDSQREATLPLAFVIKLYHVEPERPAILGNYLGHRRLSRPLEFSLKAQGRKRSQRVDDLKTTNKEDRDDGVRRQNADKKKRTHQKISSAPEGLPLLLSACKIRPVSFSQCPECQTCKQLRNVTS